MENISLKLCLLLVFFDCATCLIIPEELPTILSLIYSNIPPIRKGTDSRVGIGFRLGEHADFQVLFEMGPQTETESLGSSASKKRRAVLLDAAIRGEMGPLAQAVANYQIQRKLQQEFERIKLLENNKKKSNSDESKDKKTPSSEWLSKWSKDMEGSPEAEEPLKDSEMKNPSLAEAKVIDQRIGRPANTKTADADKILQLTKLYKQQTEEKTDETV